MSIREASCRIFSNASGSYSSNVNLAVENRWATWRKPFGYTTGSGIGTLLLVLIAVHYTTSRPASTLDC